MITKLFEFNKKATLDIYNLKKKKCQKEKYNDRSFNAYKVYWEYGPKSQKRRFKNLLEMGVQNGDTVLDFGCGLGDLYEYTKELGLNIKYIGVDINDNFIKDAIAQYGMRLKHLIPFKDINPKFYTIDTIYDVKENYDWFLASGAFTYSFEVDDIIEILKVAYNKCNKGIVFNVLPTTADTIIYKSKMGKDNMCRYNPELLLNEIKKYFPNAKLVRKDTGDRYFQINDDAIFYILKN